ncbi:MAG: hypothetical protein E5Y31_25845 [Mesorhizobium sp.]|nr:MAG: hypothetical protein E5Y31_25845 [Mesorhizobium sp.]
MTKAGAGNPGRASYGEMIVDRDAEPTTVVDLDAKFAAVILLRLLGKKTQREHVDVLSQP